MSKKSYKIGLISDFNLQNFAVFLRKNPVAETKCVESLFGQTARLLLDHTDTFWSTPLDAVVVWTLPQMAAPTFQKTLSFVEFSNAELLREVTAFCELIKKIPANIRTIIVPSWVAPGLERGLGPANLKKKIGVAHALMQMNLMLAEEFEKERRIILLDTNQWLLNVGVAGFNPKLWYLSKTPFQNSVFQEAASDIIASIEGLNGRAKKVLILDLDNTLWGGILGDDGWNNLRLGGHDAIGEAFTDFQKNLKRLANRGVLLALASKNDEVAALEAIRSHPEMILKLEDFAAWKINWNDKAANIAELMALLKLGLDSAVFLDDSAFERARVREALPEVFVPDLPEDPLQLPSFLVRLRCFDHPVISVEDRTRTTMYVADRERVATQSKFPSLADWLAALELSVIPELLNAKNLERAAQLFNKTNQMNLSTRRLSAAELLAWSQTPGNYVYTFRVADKFGDYGLCGIGSLTQKNSHGKIVDFLLSCRVMGRGVEETMFCTLAQHARSMDCKNLHMIYELTSKNQPMGKWLVNHPQLRCKENLFEFSLHGPISFPEHIARAENP